jgi:hypothetical protein
METCLTVYVLVWWLVLRAAERSVGGGAEVVVPRVLLATVRHFGLVCSGELLHLLTGAAPLDPGRESVVLSLKVDDGSATRLASLRLTRAQDPRWRASSLTLLLLLQ